MEARTEKSGLTLAAIVDTALELAADNGLDAITIGDVAQRLAMSKSGVFSRVGSREALQRAVLDEYAARITNEVFVPAMRQPRGLPRLQAAFNNWIDFQQRAKRGSGCLFMAGAFEFDDRMDSPLREVIFEGISRLRAALRRSVLQAQEHAHLRADVEPEQIVFEVYGLMAGLMHDVRFMRDPRAVERSLAAFNRLVDSYRPAATRSQ
jgi:AcrR family transcriptional regulator